MDYYTYLRTKLSTKYDRTVSRFIAELVKKVKPQMKTNFFHLEKVISDIGFMATF